MFLKPFLEFKFYLILMYILICGLYMIRSIFTVCHVLLYSQLIKKIFSTMLIGKIPWLIRFGRVRLTDTISPC